MFRVLFCTALMGLTQVQPISGDKCQCGVVTDDIVSMRIVGGRKAAPHAFPWAVAILKMDFLHCGGALITDRHVLSAGHCFQWDHLKLLSMLAGLSNLDRLDGVEKRTFSNAIVHENFSSTATRDDNDIAIAVLSSPVKFGDTIKPVCLPRPFQQFGNYAGTIVGWGRLGEDEPASKDLLQAKLNILTDDKCTSSILKEHLTVNMMCATAKGIDGCQGDSGGPLVVFDPSGRYIQAGVTSWGIGCADPRFPGVYTKVSYYIDWIKKNTADGKTCNKS